MIRVASSQDHQESAGGENFDVNGGLAADFADLA
jgi:hypothetical protein